MYTDLFRALLNKENPRGHPILAALAYAFCPAAVRWWLAGADPVIPFDPLWQALEDLVSGSTLKAALSSYGFDDLLDIAQKYVDRVEDWRSHHLGIRAPELLPTFLGGRIEMPRRFAHRVVIRKFFNCWENFFAYLRAWVFVIPDWQILMRFSEPPQISPIQLALMLPGIRHPVYFPTWSWVDQVKKTRRMVVGLIVTARTQDQLRLSLARRANPLGNKPWPSTPEVWALDWESGNADRFEKRLPTNSLPHVVIQLAEAAKSGPHPPLAALRGSSQCTDCGFRAQCYVDSGEISYLALSQ